MTQVQFNQSVAEDIQRAIRQAEKNAAAASAATTARASQKRVERLVELILDTMGDERLELESIVDELKSELGRRGREVRDYPRDWTPDEYDYWTAQADDARRYLNGRS